MVESTHAAGLWSGLAEPFRALSSRIADWFAPASEAASVEDAYEIMVELPGVKLEDIDVSVHDGALTIKGEKHAERTEEGRTYFFSERQYGAFQRTFRLPEDAEEEGVDAEFVDGVLRVRVPRRSPETRGARRIEVKKA